MVAPLQELMANIGPTEKAYILPDVSFDGPLPWNQETMDIIARAEQYVKDQVAPKDNRCGGCTSCCRIPFIRDPDNTIPTKPSGVNCLHCTGHSCSIYDKRPQVCREFKCLWLRSQATDQPWPLKYRPDKCGVMLDHDTGWKYEHRPYDPDLVEVHPDREKPFAILTDDMQVLLRYKKLKHITFYYGESNGTQD
jgi:hypothetical protein